jgi:predicted 2-oxoglutarate/Fe(II)-dependent dioxygenase YbiX/peroxiredoxin
MGMPDGDKARDEFTYINLAPGDPSPWFEQRTQVYRQFPSNSLGGRYSLLCFFGSSRSPAWQTALSVVRSRPHYFDVANLVFFGVTVDTQDEAEGRLEKPAEGITYCYDFDGRVSEMFGALPCARPVHAGQRPFRQIWIVLDRLLRVLANIPFSPDGGDAGQVLAVLDGLPPFGHAPEPYLTPPLLLLPGIFKPELCSHLISLFEAAGGAESGFMLAKQSKTVEVLDHRFKRRRDYHVEDQRTIDEIRKAFHRRLVPEIAKFFQFNATHIERHVVACYSAEDRGHFDAHRDNTTPGTAHRRFAVTVNLNSDFDGGDLCFPEFGSRAYRVPVGGAIVFSCTLMHAAGVVTRGTRYAFVTFLYDEAAARIRQASEPDVVTLKDQK